MTNKRIYVEQLNKILNPIAFYIWIPINATDIEERVDYIQYRLLFDELTKEQYDLIIEAGNLKFVYSIDMNVDSKGQKFLLIKTINLKNLIMLKETYMNKQLEINIHLKYINDKINKYNNE